MAMHVFGVTNDDNLWHTILPDQPFFGDVDGTGGTGRPWGPPTDSATVRDSACAADSEGNLHVLVVSSDGRLWHTRRNAGDGKWSHFGDVEKGGAGDIGTVTAVAAATEDAALRILAVNSRKELHETVWNPPTPAGLPARFDPKFHKVGTWNPAKGLLHTLAASGFPTQPPAGSVRVVLDAVPVLRETGGAAPHQRVVRLQQLLNLAGLGANPTTGSGLLSETGVYDAATAAAVRRLQQANNLPQDGVMNADTWKALLTPWLSGQAAGP